MGKLKDELYEYKQLKERAKSDYSEFQNSKSDNEKVSKIKDKSNFVMFPPDASGKVMVYFFPDYLYNWFESASAEFYEYCQRNNDPTYEIFKKIFNAKKEH